MNTFFSYKNNNKYYIMDLMDYMELEFIENNKKARNKLSLMLYGVEYEKLVFKSDDINDLRSSNIDFDKMKLI
jgi:translation elongation factor P/translation initiation factor 5A